MKKKVVALLLTLVMLVGIIPAAVYAAGDAKVTLTVTPDKATAKAGEEVTFTVSMATEEALGSMAFLTVFPEGLEYVDNSGAIDAGAKSAFSFDGVEWTEWSSRGGAVKGDNYVNGFGSVSKAGDAVICTFKAVLADDAAPGEYAIDLTGLDEFADLDWNTFDTSDIEVVSTPVVVEAEPKVILTVAPEKDTAVIGEEVTFTVSMATEETLGSMAFVTVFPEGIEYVDNSGAIDGGAKAAFGFDGIEWTEWSSRGGASKGDNYVNGFGSVSKAGDAVICSFKVLAKDLGEYEVSLTGLDEFADLDWNTFDTSVIKVVSETLTVIDHVCSADKLTFVEANEPTCTDDGNVAYYVCECGTKYVDEAMSEIIPDTIVPATGHSKDAEAAIENEVAADCDDEGSYDEVVYCTVCGEELSRETFTVDALGHTDGTPVVENNVDATCTEDGSYEEVIYCEVCDEELSRDPITVDALGHDYEADVTDPDCVNGGYTTYTCTVCGDSYVADNTDALGHTADDVVYENVSDATCTTEGTGDAVIYCAVCGEELSRETSTVPALGHTAGEEVEENRTEATCTADGSFDTVVYCTVCGEELSRETSTISALGHTAGEEVEENRTEATCTADGSFDTVVYCTVCGEELSRETSTISALGHTAGEEVEENRTEATCTADGSFDTVVYCTVCDAELSRETSTIPALGHTAGEEVEENRTEATCTADGSFDTVVYCTVCDAELSRETSTIPALGHSYGTSVTEPTCTEQGYTTYTCTVCGDSYVADYVDAIGHDFPAKEEWVESETEKGWYYGYCKNGCGEALSEQRTIFVEGVALDQDYVETYYVRKAPAFTLTEIITPETADEEYTVTWTSSNEKVATVDEDGNVTTHKRGEAVITVTVTSEDGTKTFTDSCTVKVKYTWWQWLIWFFLLGCCWYFV